MKTRERIQRVLHFERPDHLPVIDIEVQKPAVFSRSCAAPGDPPEETSLRIEHRKLITSVAYVVPSVVFDHLYHRPYQRRIAGLKRDQAVAGQDTETLSGTGRHLYAVPAGNTGYAAAG